MTMATSKFDTKSTEKKSSVDRNKDSKNGTEDQKNEDTNNDSDDTILELERFRRHWTVFQRNLRLGIVRKCCET